MAAALPGPAADEVAPREEEPDAALVARETIELGFLALIQLLPAAPARRADPARRARFAGQETADALETASPRSTARCSGRARRSRDRAPAGAARGRADAELTRAGARAAATASSTPTSAATPTAALALMADDIRITMPPLPLVYDGHRRACSRCSCARSSRGGRRVAARPDPREPDARRRELPPRARARHVPPFKLDVLRVRDGDRRDHDVRRVAVRGARAAGCALAPLQATVASTATSARVTALL